MSYKSEFTDVYNYLENCCKDPSFFVPSSSDDLFEFTDESHSIIYDYYGDSKGINFIRVPNGVKEIGCSKEDYGYLSFEDSLHSVIVSLKGCFQDSANLETVFLPNGLQIIGILAFAQCESLYSIKIPNSVTTIGDLAFSYCGFESINIPEGVTYLGHQAFFNCVEMQSVFLPDSIKDIGPAVFLGCMSLETISCPSSLDLKYADVPAACEIIYR